jgi:predicted transcriptional regulator of viral defense system
MTALAFYRKISALGRVTTREAAQITGLEIPAASMALRRLAAEGLATPLKRGHWLFGDPAMKPGLLVTAAADPYPAYLSGWSALRIHDRIQQIPQRHFAMTLGRPGARTIAGTVIALHHITPKLFGGFSHDPRVGGFVASAEKAIFDLAYLATMNRSAVSGHLPETDLRRLRWSEVKGWLARIQRPTLRQAVESQVQRIRRQHAEVGGIE